MTQNALRLKKTDFGHTIEISLFRPKLIPKGQKIDFLTKKSKVNFFRQNWALVLKNRFYDQNIKTSIFGSKSTLEARNGFLVIKIEISLFRSKMDKN